jgi:nitroreductase
MELHTTEKTAREAIEYRRSVRIFQPESLDTEKVKECIRLAALAPNSSNMQLWEFYHITSAEMLRDVSKVCMDQNASKNAKEMVVFVVRKDLWKARAKANAEIRRKLFGSKPFNAYTKREQDAIKYFTKVMPILYMDFFGLLGGLKWLIAQVAGIFRPMYRQLTQSDMRIVAHKSTALACENFMISMAAIGYDTCPMEGLDSLRLKRLLKLPYGAEISMVIACGIRVPEGIYWPQHRIPFEEVYHER